MASREQLLRILDALGHYQRLDSGRGNSWTVVCGCGAESGERRTSTDANAWGEYHRRQVWRTARTEGQITDDVLLVAGVPRAAVTGKTTSNTWAPDSRRQPKQTVKRRRTSH